MPSVLRISSFIYNNKAKFVINEWRISGALKAGATPKAPSDFTPPLGPRNPAIRRPCGVMPTNFLGGGKAEMLHDLVRWSST